MCSHCGHRVIVSDSYQEHFLQATSHELIAKVDFEVDVFWSVNDGIDELKGGQLQHRIVGLFEGSQNRFKSVYVTHLSIDSDSF